MVAAVLMISSDALTTSSAIEITITMRTCNGTPPALAGGVFSVAFCECAL
jgi:hypothetical protein